mmetsp:Transcript_99966/g.285754  ORF Transcript_99966/g.285754 Transcript_99966/m.285754 type:complete len:235 (-) Transcript_99966:7471-8175(-)
MALTSLSCFRRAGPCTSKVAVWLGANAGAVSCPPPPLGWTPPPFETKRGPLSCTALRNVSTASFASSAVPLSFFELANSTASTVWYLSSSRSSLMSPIWPRVWPASLDRATLLFTASAIFCCFTASFSSRPSSIHCKLFRYLARRSEAQRIGGGVRRNGTQECKEIDRRSSPELPKPRRFCFPPAAVDPLDQSLPVTLNPRREGHPQPQHPSPLDPLRLTVLVLGRQYMARTAQ